MKNTAVISVIVIILTGGLLIGFGKSEEAPSFPPGIYLCQEPLRICEVWANVQNFNYEPKWRQAEISEESGQLLKDISENGCLVVGQVDIGSAFSSKITDIYFVPAIKQIATGKYTGLYGAILHEEGFKGECQVVCKYREWVGGVFTAEHEPVAISNVSSIRPFEIVFGPSPEWKVTLYKKPRSNKGYPAETSEASYSLGDIYTYYKEFDLDLPPQSLKITGDLIAVLLAENGESEVFSRFTGSGGETIKLSAKKLIIISGRFLE